MNAQTREREPHFALRAVAAVAFVLVAGAFSAARAQDTLTADTQYFSIHVQADPNLARELFVRLGVLGDEYAAVGRLLGVMPRSKLHLYVTCKPEEYKRLGGSPPATTTHILNEHRLIMQAPGPGSLDWGNLQEVCWQQFFGAAMNVTPPLWVSSGLGTYFKSALWTGDGVMTGIVHPELVRLARMGEKENKAPAIDKMVGASLKDWYQESGVQDRMFKAWGMVQFLLHADGGKYRAALGSYVQECNHGTAGDAAFGKVLGDPKAFQTRYATWLNSPQADANQQQLVCAEVATLASFLARGHYLRLKFETADDFLRACKEGKVLVDPAKNAALWLPESLLKQAVQKSEGLGTWALDTKKSPPSLILVQQDGTTITATILMPTGGRPAIKIDVKAPKTAASGPKT